MNETIATRIPLLDDHIGGFLAGKAYLVFGDGGSGKSLLGLQYALRGAEAGEPAVLLTLDRPADLIAQAESLGLSLDPVLGSGELILLEYDQDVTSRIMRYGWKPFLDRLGALRAERPIRRVVFDPIHPLFAGSTEEGRLRYDLRYLVETLEEWGWTTLFLHDRGATQGHPSLYRVFSEICHGMIELQDEVESLESSKYLFIHKLRQPSDRMRKIPFQIIPERGIVEGAASGGGRSESPPRPDRPKVLLADDDPFIRSLLRKKLREEFEILMAEDGVEALTLTLQHSPDVVVLDVMFPKLSGFEVCRSLRSCGFNRSILFVSGIEDPKERVRGLALGANDFITKPFRADEVVEKIRTASRTILALDASGFERADLPTLLRNAHSRTLEVEAFREKLLAACEGVDRFGVPLGIVRFGWPPDPETAEQAVHFREAIERATRPEDLLTFPGPGAALVALPTEDGDGVLSYLRKLRRAFEDPRLDGPRARLPGRLAFACWVLRPGEKMPGTMKGILERLGEPNRGFFDDRELASGPGTAAGAAAERTGTDG